MKKLGLLVMPLMAVSFLASCGSKHEDLYIKLTSSNCELRKTIDSQGTDSIKIAYGSKNLDFYIYPTVSLQEKHIDIISITTNNQDFSEHCQEVDPFHFTTDNTSLTKDLFITADAVDTLKVIFHSNDGSYSDGKKMKTVRGIVPGETFGEVEKRLSEKPSRSMYDKLEGWTDVDKTPIPSDLEINDNITVFADYIPFECYAVFNDLNEHIDQSNMQHYAGLTYMPFNPDDGFEFTFLFKDGYKFSENGLAVYDETMPGRDIFYTISGNTLSISSTEVADHNLKIGVPNVALIQYEVHKPVHNYLSIDDAGFEHPTIESQYRANLTFKEGYSIPNRDRVIITIGGKIYNDFLWLHQGGTNVVQLVIPKGDVCGTIAYDVVSYELKVYGTVINDLSPESKIKGMTVTLTSNDTRFPYIATTSTDANGNYSFTYIEDTSYTISIDLSTGTTAAGEVWVSNEDTLTITIDEIRHGISKNFYVADYNQLTTQSLYIKVNDNYSNFDISAYNGLANATYIESESHYVIDLKKDYNPNLLLRCNAYKSFAQGSTILEMPTTVVPVDMASVSQTLNIDLNAYKNWGERIVCRNIIGGSHGCFFATSRKNKNFAFMLHYPGLDDGSIYKMAFTCDNSSQALDNRTFIVEFTSAGKVLSITNGSGEMVNNPEMIHVYTHPAKDQASPAIEIVTTTDFIKAQGIIMTDDQNIYCTLQSERGGYYGEFEQCHLDNPSTYQVLKSDGTFETF